VDTKKKVLICPLDWGIGHAARCVPIIRQFQSMGWEVVAAADGRPQIFLKKEFPDLDIINFPGIKVNYPKNRWMAFHMLRRAPSFLIGFRKEHQRLKKLADEVNPDLIISDNRYGCWHSRIPSVFITHQLEIQVPFRLVKRILNFINIWFINHYMECWVPDFELHHGLAGNLSHPAKLPRNTYYIGILSRFHKLHSTHNPTISTPLDLLVMLSGPEPQRSILQEKIIKQLDNINMQVAIVQGLPEVTDNFSMEGRIQVFSHLETKKMYEIIKRAKMIICRSGYSSIMDVVTLGKKAVFIPTPGQTEQEYLAHYLMDKKIFFSMDQKKFDLLYALEMSKNFPGMVIENDYQYLQERIQHFN